MELFVHTEGGEDPDIVNVEVTDKVRTLMLETEPDGRIWIEEVDEEIDLDITFEEAGIGHRHHVHRGRCHRIKVVVQFNSVDFTHEYGPGTTIRTVKHWATGPEAANLSAEQRAKHVLALPDADHYLADGVHIGSLLTKDGPCEIVLNLLPEDSFEG